MNVAIALAIFATGVFVLVEPRHRSTGAALLAAGLIWPLNWVNEWGFGPLPVIAQMEGPLAQLLVAWALLRYPARWHARWRERLTTVMLIALQLASVADVLSSRPEWHGLPADTVWLTVWADPDLYDVVDHDLYDVGGAIVAGVVMLLMVLRYRGLRSFDRRTARPVLIAVLAAAGLIAIADLAKSRAVVDAAIDRIYVLEALAILGIPLAFLSAAILRWYAFATVPKLVERLRSAPTALDLQDVLRARLQDPGLAVYYRLDGGGYLDSAGQPIDELPRTGRRFLLRAGERPEDGVVVVDPVLGQHLSQVEPALQAAALVVANTRLHLLVAARIAEVERSADRLAAAVAVEKRRVADDLAGGALRHLDAAATGLHALADTAGPGLNELLHGIGDDARRASIELDTLSRGRLPLPLAEQGLGAALHATLDPQVVIDVRCDRVPLAIEAVAYFAICEFVTNAVKHASARRITVIGSMSGGSLTVEVRDDGVGGADPAGSGLRGIATRVGRLGGELELASLPGQGTVAVVRLPPTPRGPSPSAVALVAVRR